MKRSCGASGLSASAASGQAPTQDRHIVHLSLSIASVPNGEPAAGRAMDSAGLRRLRQQVVERQIERGALVGLRRQRGGFADALRRRRLQRGVELAHVAVASIKRRCVPA